MRQMPPLPTASSLLLRRLERSFRLVLTPPFIAAMTAAHAQAPALVDQTWAIAQPPIEAGPSGTFTVSGTYRAPDLSLVLHYDNGRVGSYSATLTDASHMNGTIAFSGQAPSQLEFVKE